MKLNDIKTGDILFRIKPDIAWVYVYFLVTSINNKEAEVIQLQLLDTGVLNIFMNDKIKKDESLLDHLAPKPNAKKMLIKDLFKFELHLM